MEEPESLDVLFHEAVSAIDAGDVPALERQLVAHPNLVRNRLESPGVWLRDQVGDALEGFFARPYLLWFVAEDPVRNGKLPSNIVQVAQTIIDAAKRQHTDSLQEQLDYTLRLVCWSWIARECGVQVGLIDLLADEGASVDGHHLYGDRYGTNTDAAIYNGNFSAAERLLEHGAAVTLTTALCLGRWVDFERLVATASLDERQDAFVQAAMGGNAEALRRMLAIGVHPTTISARTQSHATALHHAVFSGSLDAVRTLVEAGAELNRRDTIYDATPLGWASYCGQQEKDGFAAKKFAEIAAYLQGRGGKE
jgi:hypothetical protein